jgi:hypothetical protein
MVSLSYERFSGILIGVVFLNPKFMYGRFIQKTFCRLMRVPQTCSQGGVCLGIVTHHTHHTPGDKHTAVACAATFGIRRTTLDSV